MSISWIGVAYVLSALIFRGVGDGQFLVFMDVLIDVTAFPMLASISLAFVIRIHLQISRFSPLMKGFS
jgi:hypothetical protein